MANNDIFRLAVEGIGPNGQDLVNVFHYRQNDLVGSDDGETLIDAWIEDVMPSFLAAISASASVVSFSVRNLTQVGLGVDRALSPAEPGDLAGDALPPTSAAIITWLTGLIGRRNRGRTYMWPASEGSQTAGQISGGYDTQLSTFATAALAPEDSGTGADYVLVVHSDVGATNRDVTDFQVRQFLGTQRRRRVGVGT